MKNNELLDFIDKNKNKKLIAIQGLGFVGSAMSLVCANAINGDYAVIGVDQPTNEGLSIVNSLNDGVFPFIAEDPKIDELFKTTIKKNNFIATTNDNAFKYVDIIIVDINLDVKKNNNTDGSLKNYNVDLSLFKEAIKTIGKKCKSNVLILVETTVPPGTCQKVVKPIIFDMLKKRGFKLSNVRIGHSYERVMPGPNYIDSIQNYFRVYSGIDKKSSLATRLFLETIISTDKYPLTELGDTTSTEIAKVLENSYRATNISFMVEWTRFAEEAGINIYEVIDSIRMRNTHSNLMYPGLGVGGYCLTKDSLLASWAKQNLINSDEGLLQSEKAISVNDQMPRYAFEFLCKYYSKLSNLNILLLGVSYRGDVGDTRSSPVEILFNLLTDGGANLFCHDPYIKYWNEKSIEINSKISSYLNYKLDIIIVSTGHSVYKHNSTIDLILNLDPLFIYDTIGHFSQKQIDRLSKKHKVKVLGRGDI